MRFEDSVTSVRSLFRSDGLFVQALEIALNDTKALFRKAQGEAAIKEFDLAKASLSKAIQLEPDNQTLRLELNKYYLACQPTCALLSLTKTILKL